MAASPVVTENLGSMGSKAARIVTITLDSSYAAGGEAITANACGLSNITSLIPLNTTGGYIPIWDQTNLKLLMTRPGLRSISQTATAAAGANAMTDGGSTSGYIDFTTALPIGAIPISSQFACSGAFAGDTTAVWKLGISGDLDRYSTTTSNSCFTAITTSSLTKTTGLSATNAAQTPRLTITGGADFTSIVSNGTGVGVATLFYLNSAGSLAGEETAAVDLSAVAVTALVLGTP
jgi:hypothetical protein